MLIDKYADMYRQATSGAGKGAFVKQLKTLLSV